MACTSFFFKLIIYGTWWQTWMMFKATEVLVWHVTSVSLWVNYDQCSCRGNHPMLSFQYTVLRHIKPTGLKDLSGPGCQYTPQVILCLRGYLIALQAWFGHDICTSFTNAITYGYFEVLSVLSASSTVCSALATTFPFISLLFEPVHYFQSFWSLPSEKEKHNIS